MAGQCRSEKLAQVLADRIGLRGAAPVNREGTVVETRPSLKW
jgi:hypothetical protein